MVSGWGRMLVFSIIDDKTDCASVFASGKIQKNIKPRFLSKTWTYNEKLEGIPIEYAEIYCGGKTIKQVCPPELHDVFQEAEEKKRHFERSFETAKVKLEDVCFYDLVPEWFIKQYFEIQNKIIENVFETYQKPKNHDFLVKLLKLTSEIEKYEINHKLPHYQNRTLYNIYGAITGRFGLKPHSFPILNLMKEKRSSIFPNNDFFMSLDFNGAEIRTALGLLEKPQPSRDIYEAFMYLFPGKTRDETKKEILSLWYNSNEEVHLKEIIEKDKFIQKFWDGERIYSLMGREIKCDREHVIPYMNQATTAELVFDRCCEIQELLRTKQTKIAFIIHDEVILDMPGEEKHLIPEIRQIFSNTKLGQFVVRCKTGLNLGEMKENG